MIKKMTTQKYTGKTVEEATKSALEKLGLKREDVEIKVLNPGRGGVLGLGGEAAEIEVTVSSVNLDIQSSSDSLITEKDQNKNSFKKLFNSSSAIFEESAICIPSK